MAKRGSGSFNLDLGTIHSEFRPDFSQAIKDAQKFDEELKKIGRTMSSIAGGKDVSSLWNEQAASIENVAEALERFRRSENSVGSAEGLMKALNAFSAWHPDESITSYLDRLGSDAQTLIDKAKQLGSGLDSAFSVPSLREAFQAFEMLKSTGIDLEQVFAKLKAGDVDGLNQQIEMLQRQLSHARMEAEALQERVSHFESGQTFSDMQERLETFESTMERAKDEFRSFLQTAGFSGEDLDDSWGRFSRLFDQIANGSITVKEAMAQVREEYSHMFQSAGADQIMEVLAKLEQLSTAIDGIRDGMARMGSGNAATASLGEMRQYLEEGAQAADRTEKELSELSMQGQALSGLIDVITRLAEANTAAGEGATNAHQSLIELVQAVQQLGSVDAGKLQQISDVLKSIGRMDGMSVSAASVRNMVSAFESLSQLPSTSSLTALSAIDFSNLSNLKVSKASLSNMAEFLPTITGINVAPLQQLASINWENLNNLHITKSTVSNLTELASATNVGADRTGAEAAQSAFAKIGDSLDALRGKVAETFNLEPAIAQAERLTQAYSQVRGALELVRDLAAAYQKSQQADKSADNAQKSADAKKQEQAELSKLIDLYEQYYNLESKKIKAVNSGDIENADIYRQRAQGIWEEINAIETLNPAMANLAGESERVTAAVQKWQAAANAGQLASDNAMLRQAEALTAEFERLQGMLNNLQLGTSGIKFEGNAEAVQRYTNAISAAQQALENVRTSTESNRAAAIDAYTQQIEAVKRLRDELNNMYGGSATNKQLESFKKQWLSFTQANTSWYSKNKTAYDEIWAKISSGAQLSASELKQLQTEFLSMNNAMTVARAGGKSFFDEMKAGWRKFGGWSIVTRTFTAVIRVMKQAVTAVKEVDAAMVELRKVTQLTENQYAEFYEAAAKSAKRIGSSLSDVINATAD